MVLDPVRPQTLWEVEDHREHATKEAKLLPQAMWQRGETKQNLDTPMQNLGLLHRRALQAHPS